MHDKSENVCLCVCVCVHGEKKSGQESDRGLTFVCTDTKPLLMNVILQPCLCVCVCVLVCMGVEYLIAEECSIATGACRHKSFTEYNRMKPIHKGGICNSFLSLNVEHIVYESFGMLRLFHPNWS